MAIELSSGGDKRKVRVKPSMNVTPLVDVVLVLLIIFMVITPMMVKQFWLHHPKKDTSAAAADEPDDPSNVAIVVTVRDDGTIWINKDRITLDRLPTELQRIFAARDEALIFFDAEDRVPYGTAMSVLDTARGGGAVHIAVLTEGVIK